MLATVQHSLQTLTVNRAGNVQLVACDSPVGRLGLSVCYDLRFPAVYQELAFGRGAEVLLVPSAFTVKTGVLPPFVCRELCVCLWPQPCWCLHSLPLSVIWPLCNNSLHVQWRPVLLVPSSCSHDNWCATRPVQMRSLCFWLAVLLVPLAVTMKTGALPPFFVVESMHAPLARMSCCCSLSHEDWCAKSLHFWIKSVQHLTAPACHAAASGLGPDSRRLQHMLCG